MVFETFIILLLNIYDYESYPWRILWHYNVLGCKTMKWEHNAEADPGPSL